jgi:MFS family permease
VALSDITRDLFGSELLAWVVSGYLLAMTGSTPIFGKLSDLFGRRRLLAIAISVFVLASLLSGLAQDMAQLMGCPVAPGILLLGGAALGLQFPTALVAVQSAAPSSHLGVVTGVCDLFRGLGDALGVALLTSLLWQLLPRFSSNSLPEVGGALSMVDSSALGDAFAQLLLIDAVTSLIPLLIPLGLEDRTLSHKLSFKG